MQRVLIDAIGHPLACQRAPRPIATVRKMMHQHPPGREGLSGKGGGQEHRGEDRRGNERRQNGVAEVRHDDPGTLRVGKGRPERTRWRRPAGRRTSGTSRAVPSNAAAVSHASASPSDAEGDRETASAEPAGPRAFVLLRRPGHRKTQLGRGLARREDPFRESRHGWRARPEPAQRTRMRALAMASGGGA